MADSTLRSLAHLCLVPLLATGALPAVSAAWAGQVQPAAPVASDPFGQWRNPADSVHIRVQPCGVAMCGVVIWASDKAIADSRRGGTANLVGTELFRNFVEKSPGKWDGKVFVPDINQTFSGTIRLEGGKTLIGRGCLIGRLFCRSQSWTRIE